MSWLVSAAEIGEVVALGLMGAAGVPIIRDLVAAVKAKRHLSSSLAQAGDEVIMALRGRLSAGDAAGAVDLISPYVAGLPAPEREKATFALTQHSAAGRLTYASMVAAAGLAAHSGTRARAATQPAAFS